MSVMLSDLPSVLVPGVIPNIELTYRETWFTETGWYLADEVDRVLDRAERTISALGRENARLEKLVSRLKDQLIIERSR